MPTDLHSDDIPLTLEERTRVTLITHALLSVFTQNLEGRAAVFQFLNRVMSLFFQPVGLLFLSYDTFKRGGVPDSQYRLIFHTIQDPLAKRSFEHDLITRFSGVQKHSSKSRRHSPRAESEQIVVFAADSPISEYLHPVFSLNYRIVLVSCESAPDSPVHGRGFHYVKPGSNQNSRMLSSVFAPTKFLAFREVVDIAHGMSEEFRELTARFGRVVDIAQGTLNSSDAAQYISLLIDSVRQEVLEGEYARIWDSPLLCKEKKNPSNIFFFLRTYTSRDLRFGAYNYDVRFIFPESQQEDIRNVLQTIAESRDPDVICAFNKGKSGDSGKLPERTSRDWYFLNKKVSVSKEGTRSYVLRTGLAPERNMRYPAHELDDQFWSHLEKQEAVDELLSCLRTRFGKDARSMSDPVFSSGIAYTLYHPFREGGLDRVKPKELARGYQSCDVRRLIASHYLFSAMAPKSGNLAILLVPIFLSGAVWMTVGVITDLSIFDQNDATTESRSGGGADYTNEPLPQLIWERFYHFYYDIGVRLARRIRFSAKKLFMHEVYTVVFQGIRDLSDVMLSGGKYNPRRRIYDIHRRLSLIALVYPFDVPSIEVIEVTPDAGPPNDTARHEIVLELFDDTDLYVNVKRLKNNNFPRLVEKEYLSDEELWKPVREAVDDGQRYYLSRSKAKH